ncbi:hypothetical protein K438DRAFT_1771730 [Mycena galopus ATCC 62051]|nr:hypothetical protein K438DRAFT_1771730 [Mycena galopus ATCC 62051]
MQCPFCHSSPPASYPPSAATCTRASRVAASKTTSRRVCRLGVGDTSSGKGFRAVDDTARATRHLAGCRVEGRETIVRNAEGERNRVVPGLGGAVLQPSKKGSWRRARVRGERYVNQGGLAIVRVSWEDGEDASRGIGAIFWKGQDAARSIRMRCFYGYGFRRDAHARLFSRTRTLLASDLGPPIRAETASLARQHRRVGRTHHQVARNPRTNQQRLCTPATLIHSRRPGHPAPAHPPPPRAELDVDSSASTCEPMLGNAGAGLHPRCTCSCRTVSLHRPTPPLASDGAGNRGGSESQERGRGRDGEDGLTAAGGQRAEVAARRMWGGEVDGRPRCYIPPNVQESVSTASMLHRKRGSGGVPRPARTRHQGHKDMKHHPRLGVFGSGSTAGADTCADARTGIAASYDRAWIIGVPPARQMAIRKSGKI